MQDTAQHKAHGVYHLGQANLEPSAKIQQIITLALNILEYFTEGPKDRRWPAELGGLGLHM